MILPRRADRGIVVFWVLPSLAYRVRLAASFLLVATGCLIQAATGALLLGLVLLLAGNVLLLVKGYDNRVSRGRYDPDRGWQVVETEKLEEIQALHKRMRRWDRSALDITNPLGVIVLLLVAVPIVAAAGMSPGVPRLLAIDAAALLLPHWVTGTRSILVRPKLEVQIAATRLVLASASAALARHTVRLLMLLPGAGARIPDDVKFRVDLKDHDADFLGLYGQVVINDVQGTSYPYFYVVLVAKRDYGLGAVYRSYEPPRNIVKEFNTEREVEVLVIRQRTTKTSGYHTKPAAAEEILREGLRLAERVAVKAAV
jgi:hypothetical protein